MSGTAAALALAAPEAAAETRILYAPKRSSSLNKIRIGLIGAGIIGHYDADTALSTPNVELVAVCDLYTGRLEYAHEKWGKDIFTTRDYREVLARPDIDAVLICTPDHWHARLSVDALNAGKHVYCEKPMVKKLEDGLKVIEAWKKSGKVMQVGSQTASSVATLEAKKQFESGIIGELTYAEATVDRWNSNGAWNYSIPLDASPETCDWDTFLNDAPKVPFDPKRFFRWRNYKDYGTGVAGDLFVHSLTELHTVTRSKGPRKVYALGDLNYWKDGRDAYDLVTGILEYPASAEHPSFQLFLRANLSDGGGGGGSFRLVGTEGVIDGKWDKLTIRHFKRPPADGYGGYDSYTSFSAKQKEEYKKWYDANYGGKSTDWVVGKPIEFKPEEGYDDRKDHFLNFFDSIRNGKPSVEDPMFGLRAAAPCVLCNMSADKKKPIFWDAENMKIIKK